MASLAALGFSFTLRLDYATYTVSQVSVDTALTSLFAAVLVVPIEEIQLSSASSQAAFDDHGVMLAAAGVATQVKIGLRIGILLIIYLIYKHFFFDLVYWTSFRRWCLRLMLVVSIDHFLVCCQQGFPSQFRQLYHQPHSKRFLQHDIIQELCFFLIMNINHN